MLNLKKGHGLLMMFVVLFLTPNSFASDQKDEQFRCIVTDSEKNVVLNDVMTISKYPLSPAQHLETQVNAEANDNSKRTLYIAVWMGRPATPGRMGMTFGVQYTNGSTDMRNWISGPQASLEIDKLNKINLSLRGEIPLQKNRSINVIYTLRCELQK